jgi:hypothetical protein
VSEREERERERRERERERERELKHVRIEACMHACMQVEFWDVKQQLLATRT